MQDNHGKPQEQHLRSTVSATRCNSEKFFASETLFSMYQFRRDHLRFGELAQPAHQVCNSCLDGQLNLPPAVVHNLNQIRHHKTTAVPSVVAVVNLKHGSTKKELFLSIMTSAFDTYIRGATASTWSLGEGKCSDSSPIQTPNSCLKNFSQASFLSLARSSQPVPPENFRSPMTFSSI